MKKQFPFHAILLVSLLFSTALFAQESIVATPGKTSILLGEPLTITITITGGQPYQAALADSLGRFEILERMPVKTEKNDGTVTSTEQIIVTSFDSGVQRLPPVTVQGNPAVSSPGFDIIVNSLPASAKTAYGDLKQIIDLQPPNQWPYILILAVIVLLSAYFIIRLNKKHALVSKASIQPETVSPENLVSQLDQLKSRWQQQEVDSVQLGNQLMQLFKKFLAGKGVNSTSKTGEELVIATKSMYDAGKWQEIVQTIRLCNAMRFGKYQAGQVEGNAGIDAFRQAIITINR
ncbi:MAG: hypothetical protein V4717_17825 [Bacteroidota bacterium]